MSDTLYVVSGFMRTGTSMMMRALEAGGMDASYRQSRETMRQHQYHDPGVLLRDYRIRVDA